MNRRDLLLAAAAASAWPLYEYLKPAPAWASPDIDGILHDPETPEGGNPKGDVTIVAFFDYNCPFCKQAEPALEKVVRADGKVRLVYKDWPILSDASIYGAQVALGARYQDRYTLVHDALMGIPGRKITKDAMRDVVTKSGVDMARLQTDLDKNQEAILGLIRRNMAQAESIGLTGTPVYLIGDRAYPNALNEAAFKSAIVRARTGKPS